MMLIHSQDLAVLVQVKVKDNRNSLSIHLITSRKLPLNNCQVYPNKEKEGLLSKS